MPEAWIGCSASVESSFFSGWTSTAFAPGWKVRITVPFLPRCGPSTLKGSPSRPRSKASSAPGSGAISCVVRLKRLLRLAFQQFRQASQRKRHPGRAVRRLVADFIRGLLDQEHPQQPLLGFQVEPRMRRLREHGLIGLAEGVAGGSREPAKQIDLFLVQLRRSGLPVGYRRRRRVIERAQDAGDIAQRTGFGAAGLQRLRRFTFEIYDMDVVLHHQDLAEMEVA